MKSWSEMEFSAVDFGDKRIEDRFKQLAERLVLQPMSPINQACEDWAESKAAYRFFQNEKVSSQKILSAHQDKIKERLRGHELVLAIQDTTFLSYNGHKKTTGLGNIGVNQSSEIQGLVMHTALAVAPSGLPLGILHQHTWAREKRTKHVWSNSEIRRHRKQPIETKESGKWLEALQATISLSPKTTRVITVADRESDVYEFIYKARKLNSEIVIRVGQDRSIENETSKLWEHMSSVPVCASVNVEMQEKEKQPARSACVDISFTSLSLKASKTSNFKDSTEVCVIWVKEKNPPENAEPLEWMLLTTIPVKTMDQALEKVQWYRCRWQIEIYHKILKSGCRVEECRLQSADRLKRFLGLMGIIAWRIYWLTYMCRTNPDAPCTSVLADHEWKALHARIKKTRILPEQIPTVGQSLRWIARLGGFLDRKSDGDPGPITIWRGWHRLNDIATTWAILSS